MRTATSTSADLLFTRLFDDAAMFPPGNLPLESAVPAHEHHLRGAHAPMVGPLVMAAKDLGRLASAIADRPMDVGDAPLDLAVTVPLGQVVDAILATRAIPSVRLKALEIALSPEDQPRDVARTLRSALADAEVDSYVEVPRDERREAVISALTGTPYRAKLRTGGVRADLYPDETELAEAIRLAVRAGLPFKTTAGLHHAVRNTDPLTGFEQHGFLNLLNATAAAGSDANQQDLVSLLSERDGSRVAEQAGALDPGVRTTFHSFGTCSIAEPVGELIELGLLDAHLKEDLA